MSDEKFIVVNGIKIIASPYLRDTEWYMSEKPIEFNTGSEIRRVSSNPSGLNKVVESYFTIKAERDDARSEVARLKSNADALTVTKSSRNRDK